MFLSEGSVPAASLGITGLLKLNGAAGLPAHGVRQGERWLSSLLENGPVVPRRHRATSAALVTGTSVYGCGALLFRGSVGPKAVLYFRGRGAFWNVGKRRRRPAWRRTGSRKVRRPRECCSSFSAPFHFIVSFVSIQMPFGSVSEFGCRESCVQCSTGPPRAPPRLGDRLLLYGESPYRAGGAVAASGSVELMSSVFCLSLCSFPCVGATLKFILRWVSFTLA
uniref:Uncharacterized protein n=1 Tax=Trypanosoma vivax (strain Y486) TaxID=1055687 RepID=G0TVQ7_TRYVY|nr:conserved hypothetical protein, in T. vivax [Trypanosoma vivax Y486]